ncbi:MAG TPA: hypothetical protein VFZ81_02040 [Burkholderiales bacterium]
MTKLILKIGIAALAVAFQGASAAEIGPPYDQLEVDRALPNIEQSEFDRVLPQFPERTRRMERSAPYDQLEVDRALPNIPEREFDGVLPQFPERPEASPWESEQRDHDD